MEIGTIIEIHTFDDGNQRYKAFNNKWKIIDTMFNGGKLKLMNCENDDIIIYSISTWKTKLLKKF